MAMAMAMAMAAPAATKLFDGVALRSTSGDSTTTARACNCSSEGRDIHPVVHGTNRWRRRSAGAAAAAVGRGITTPLLAAALALGLSAAPSSLAAPPPGEPQRGAWTPVLSTQGAKLFKKSCIGCHDMGGNILQPGATLFLKDLQRNKVATEEEIYNVTYYGKGRMPGFGERCTPRGQCTFGPRLQDDEIRLLAEFVRSQADAGWPQVDFPDSD